MDEVLKLYASFEDGKLIIERQDGEPLEFNSPVIDGECVEVLEFGCSGNAVKALQSLLNCHGQHLEVDGIFGNLTQTALNIFKDSVRLVPDGVVDMSVWTALIGR